MSPKTRLLVWGGGFIIIVLTYLSLWQSANWVFNDRSLSNPQIVSLMDSRVLSKATWAFADSAGGVRVINFLFHLCNTVLVGLILKRLINSELVAATVTILWSLNVVNVEAVAYAGGRPDLLAMMGVLIATLAAMGGGLYWPLWAIAGTILGLLGKESAIVALFTIPLMRFAVNRSWKVESTLCAVLAVISIGLWGGPHSIINMEIHSESVTMVNWFLIQSTAVIRLIGVTFFIASPTIDYDYDLIPVIVRFVAAAGFILASIVTFWYLRSGKRWAVGAAWLVLTILPRMFVQTPRSYLNEHQFYISGLGMAILVVGLLGGREMINATTNHTSSV